MFDEGTIVLGDLVAVGVGEEVLGGLPKDPQSGLEGGGVIPHEAAIADNASHGLETAGEVLVLDLVAGRLRDARPVDPDVGPGLDPQLGLAQPEILALWVRVGWRVPKMAEEETLGTHDIARGRWE